MAHEGGRIEVELVGRCSLAQLKKEISAVSLGPARGTGLLKSSSELDMALNSWRTIYRPQFHSFPPLPVRDGGGVVPRGGRRGRRV